jgi:hypothetical protein
VCLISRTLENTPARLIRRSREVPRLTDVFTKMVGPMADLSRCLSRRKTFSGLLHRQLNESFYRGLTFSTI